MKVVDVSTNESDGLDVTSISLSEKYPDGLFAAMSDNKTFHFYSWSDIAGETLKSAAHGFGTTQKH